MSRRLERIACFALLGLIAPACMASQFTFATGGFKITVPDGWPRIMQSHGDPESMVFQVPDSSPSARNALARVVVTSQSVRDIASFEHFVAEHTNHAHTLPHFKADAQRSTSTSLYYTATDGHVKQTYVERYFFHEGYAILVRCVRPTHSQAGAAWTAAFDRGCASVAASIK